MADYSGAIEMYVDEQRTFIDANPNGAIVIHKTAGGSSAQGIARYFQTNAAMVSSTYVVGPDENNLNNVIVVQCVPEKDGAAANCCLEGSYDPYWNQYGGVNLNRVTISIEHVDSALDNSTPITSAMRDVSFALVADICRRHDISADDIKTHASIDPINRARCPGNYPMQELIDFVKGGGVAPVKHVTPNKFMEQAALDEWNSFYKNTLGKAPPRTGTGIFNSWQSRLFNEGRHIGPPITEEYDSVDWNGNKIVVQQFADGRCEWNIKTNTPRWFSTGGEF